MELQYFRAGSLSRLFDKSSGFVVLDVRGRYKKNWNPKIGIPVFMYNSYFGIITITKITGNNNSIII